MVSLGEGATPLHIAERLAKAIGLKKLYLKDETATQLTVIETAPPPF
jgi:hypothetical protein